MSDTIPTRVQFFEHQFLRADDFTDEQAYHLQGLRRHNLAGHRWGILHGLEIVAQEGGGLTVQPGVAVDGYGRLLVVQRPYPISPNAFQDQASNTLEVWLLYERRPGEASPAGYAPCDDDGQPYREIETARVSVRAPDPNRVSIGGTERPDGRNPLEVPLADRDFGPQRTPPDDPARLWPVYLGQAILDDSGKPQVDLEGRPYAGLVGESIKSPSGEAYLQIGAEWPGDTNRFALYLKENPDDELPPALGAQPDLAITENGEISIYHDTTLYGDLTIDGGAMILNEGPLYGQEQPWSIYHTTANSEAQAGASVEQLRIEMAPSGSPGEVVIGHYSTQAKKFVPCLTIDQNCRVTVHGSLEVNGELRYAGITNINHPLEEYAYMMAQEQQFPAQEQVVFNTLINVVQDFPELTASLLQSLSQIVIEGFEVHEAEDDLQLIKGIGPAYEKKLRDAGVKTYHTLANSNDETLHDIIQPRGSVPDYASWRKAAAAKTKTEK